MTEQRTIRRTLSIAMAAVLAFVSAASHSSAQSPSTAPTATTAPAAAAATPTDALEPIAWAVGGEWRLDGKWANGNPIKARAVYEDGPGGRFVVGRLYMLNERGEEFLRSVTVYGRRDGTFTQWVYNDDGTARMDAASETDDGSLLFAWTKPAADGQGTGTQLRQQINKTGPDSYRWRTFMLIRGEWHTLVDGTFTREAK